MYIKLLGTGSNQCIPAFACECSICKDARKKGSKRKRLNCSAYIYDSESRTSILIDMPPQIMSQLHKNRIPDDKLNAVFLTHRHSDHTMGLKYFFEMTEKKAPWRNDPVSIYAGEYTFGKVKELIFNGSDKKMTQEGRENLFRMNYISAYKSFNVNSLKITVLETDHLNAKKTKDGKDEEAFGYLIENSKSGSIAYLVDANSNLPEKTIEFLKKKKPDSLVIDCTYKEDSPDSGHGNIKSILRIKELVNPGKIIASHIGHNNLPYDELKKYLKKNGIVMAYDGIKIII